MEYLIDGVISKLLAVGTIIGRDSTPPIKCEVQQSFTLPEKICAVECVMAVLFCGIVVYRSWSSRKLSCFQNVGVEKNVSPEESTRKLRERACQEMLKTGREGEMIDDLEEVPFWKIDDVLSIYFWRVMPGVRCYRSRTVTAALRAICSAPVPGLSGETYLDVFRTLTDSKHSGWPSHMYVWGGTVRDILRRKIGNDIDFVYTAPGKELEVICQKNNWMSSLSNGWLVIGQTKPDIFLEGMPITYNTITDESHGDFSMNWVFYDFCTDLIIDGHGSAIPAILQNKVEIPPCKWDDWVNINGVYVLFRYYKFLIRGHTHDPNQMTYIINRIIKFWCADEQETKKQGRAALNNVVKNPNKEVLEELKKKVFESWELAERSWTEGLWERPKGGLFASALSWWENGWEVMLTIKI